MKDVEEKAKNAAQKHYDKFMDGCLWPDMLEKYAEIYNNLKQARDELVAKKDRGARIEDSDLVDFVYYGHYQDLLARAIAGTALISDGYETDKKGKWILKSQPQEPPKKKFGFWN